MTKETKKIVKIDSNTRYRVSVSRSNKSIYAQIVDDSIGATIVSASSLKITEKKTPCQIAEMVGKALGKDAIAKKIKKVTFDRGLFRYHGRVKSLAEGMRSAGLEL